MPRRSIHLQWLPISGLFDDVWSLGAVLLHPLTSRDTWKSASLGDPAFYPISGIPPASSTAFSRETYNRNGSPSSIVEHAPALYFPGFERTGPRFSQVRILIHTSAELSGARMASQTRMFIRPSSQLVTPRQLVYDSTKLPSRQPDYPGTPGGPDPTDAKRASSPSPPPPTTNPPAPP